jgi:hypothetical protein
MIQQWAGWAGIFSFSTAESADHPACNPCTAKRIRIGNRLAQQSSGGDAKTMKYLLAWILGVPGGLILLWFLFNHMH